MNNNPYTNQAMIEYYRTKNCSAFNLRFSPKQVWRNQHASKVIMQDGSALVINKTSNSMTAYAINGEAQAERILFNN